MNFNFHTNIYVLDNIKNNMSFYNLYKVYVYDFVLKFYHNFLNSVFLSIVVASFVNPFKINSYLLFKYLNIKFVFNLKDA